MLEELKRRNYADSTIRSYLRAVEHSHGKRRYPDAEPFPRFGTLKRFDECAASWHVGIR